MEKLQLAITLADGHTLHVEPRPEDERLLAKLLGDGSSIEFGAGDDDLEGHAMSNEVLVDVEGHALVVRLPDARDAAVLRRALAVATVTATLVGAGVIAGLHPPVLTSTPVEQAPVSLQVQAVPGPALRAQRDEMQREAAQENVVREQQLQSIPLDADNPAIPAQALRAERDELARDQSLQAIPVQAGSASLQSSAGQSAQDATLDADNPAIPAQALRAERDEMQREQQVEDSNR